MSSPPFRLSRPGIHGVNEKIRETVNLYAIVQQVREVFSEYLKVDLPSSNFDITERKFVSAAEADQTAEVRANLSIRDLASVDDISAQIDGFALRLFNWDGAEGCAPSAEAVGDARAFHSMMLAMSGATPPEVHAPGDGEIIFQWRQAGGFIEVAFLGDRTISWSARGVSGRVEHGDDPFNHEHGILPAKLLAAIQELS